MNFIHLTKENATKYYGNQIVFKLNDKPIVSKLCNISKEYYVIENSGNRKLLSVKHPTYVIVDKTTSASSLHYSINFVKASPMNIMSFIGEYALVGGCGKASIIKIKNVSKSLYYIIQETSTKQNVDIRTTPCYIIL